MRLHLLDRVGPDLESNPLSSPLRVVVAKLIAPVDVDSLATLIDDLTGDDFDMQGLAQFQVLLKGA